MLPKMEANMRATHLKLDPIEYGASDQKHHAVN